MGKKLTLGQCQTGRDFLRYSAQHGGVVDHYTGSHAIVRGPSGGTCPVPMHPGDIPTGTRYSIVKRFITIGLGVLAILGALQAAGVL